MSEKLISFAKRISTHRIGKFIQIDISDIYNCWLTTNSNNCGYGQVSWKGKAKSVHRLMYELFYGSIPEGKILLHLCEIRACCNPLHLLPGTYSENALHMWGTFPGTEKAPKSAPYKTPSNKSPLLSHDAELIKQLWNEGMFRGDIAEKFEISPQHVSNIVYGRRKKPKK